MIQIKNISKRYTSYENTVLDAVSFCIPTQSIFGILGPNGAGKTTLITMMCGLQKPTEGEIIINGLRYDKNAKSIKALIGVVPQEYALYPTLTAYENLIYFGSMYGLKGKNLKENVSNSLENMGLKSFANKRIETFSGGMKRRINLLAAVLHQPKILFLDEPTVGVDVQSKTKIIEFLHHLNSTGTTIVYTSHHLREAQDFCTEIAILDQGKIKAIGSPKNLLESYPNTKNLEDIFIQLTGKNLRDVT
ncbi:ABC transporter ATP-binding protein [Weeksella virosa]|uniref:ABC transporter ATP-binding protein n=1 Tax=Weeksella virosa TaxID=1014 RepID=UPI0025576CD1|nr:ABC transporter ATP-binding protein [Weeksella virosa]MDK7374639.1 ABC transporter ATP-binding protein [Weeksella virosa]